MLRLMLQQEGVKISSSFPCSLSEEGRVDWWSKPTLLTTGQANESERPGIEARKRLYLGSQLTKKVAG